MLRRLLAVATLVYLSTSCPELPAAAEVGDRVVVREQIRLQKDGNREVAEAEAGEVFLVVKVEPERLLVVEGGRRGWIPAQKTMMLDEAIKHYTKVAGEQPRNAAAHLTRAYLLLYQGQSEEVALAAADAVRLNPKVAMAHAIRGISNERHGKMREALADFDKAIEIAPKSPFAHNSRAWLLATSPSADWRNGQEAIRSARLAVKFSGEKDYRYMDTLAAAYAEAGQFEEAVKWQSRAIESAPIPIRVHLRMHLDLYKAQRPYRQPAEKD